MKATPRVSSHQRILPLAPLVQISLLVAYGLLLQWIYEYRISPSYSYLGEKYRTPDFFNYILIFGMLLFISMLLPRTVHRIIDFMLWTLFVLMIAPMMLVPQFTALCSTGQALSIGIITAVTFAMIIGLVRAIPADIAPSLPVQPTIFWWVILAATLVSYGYIFSVTSVSFASLDLTTVYSVRDSYRDIIISSGPMLGYIVRLQGNVLNPFLITRGFTGGNKWLAIIGIFGQFIIFSVTGYKLIILSSVAIALSTLFMRHHKNRTGNLMLGGMISIAIVAVAIDIWRRSTSMTAIFVDRLVLVSGNLPAAYFHVFTGLPKDIWSHSFMSSLITSPYQEAPGFIVGNYLSGSMQVYANSNYVADGFANFGYLGIFIEAAVAALVLAVTASAARKLPPTVTAGVLITPLIALINASPITAILSNGFALAAALFIFAPRELWAGPEAVVASARTHESQGSRMQPSARRRTLDHRRQVSPPVSPSPLAAPAAGTASAQPHSRECHRHTDSAGKATD